MSILSETIKRLHLRSDAPYPSEQLAEKQEARDAHDKILQWRAEQRVHLVPKANSDDEFEGDSA